MRITHEHMSDQFQKWHLLDMPPAAALHLFTGPDQDGPHDHPFDFTTRVLFGGYIEEVHWLRPDGRTWAMARLTRRPGTSHVVPATRIHRIVRLLDGPCATLVTAGPTIRVPRFWRFDADGTASSAAWNEPRP